MHLLDLLGTPFSLIKSILLSTQAAALQTEDIVDKLSVTLTGEELEVIEKLYHQAIKLEVEFFAAQPISQPTIVPLSRVHDQTERHLTIFCDFDLTCTAFESSAILAEIAIVTAPKEDLNGCQLARMSSADLRKTWNLLSNEYTEEFEQCVESIASSETGLKNYTFPLLLFCLHC